MSFTALKDVEEEKAQNIELIYSHLKKIPVNLYIRIIFFNALQEVKIFIYQPK